MPKTLYPGLSKILKKHGCYMERQGKGSHEWWYCPASNSHVSVPRGIMSRPLANKILKQAGIAERI